MIRVATLTLSACLASAPGLAGAQAQDQLAVLDEVTRICSDPGLMPGNWDAALAGWQRLDPPLDMIARLAADQILQYAAIGGDLPADPSPAEAQAVLSQLGAKLADEIEAADFGDSYDEMDLRFYDHPSGWFLMVELKADDPTAHECKLSHAQPGADLIATLERPYMTTAPFSTFLGRAFDVEGYVPESTGGTANVEFLTFILDPADVDADLPPESDPRTLGSALSMSIFLFAPGREGAI